MRQAINLFIENTAAIYQTYVYACMYVRKATLMCMRLYICIGKKHTPLFVCVENQESA